MKRKVVLTLASAIVLVIVALLIVFAPFDTGRYSSGFSESKFDSIRIGMHKSQVIAVLGEPMFVDEVDLATSLAFGISEDAKRALVENCSRSGDHCWIAVLSKDRRTIEKVLGKAPAQAIVGMTYQELLERYGSPIAFHSIKVTRMAFGIGGIDFGYYRNRAIGIDQDGRVVEKWSSIIGN